MSDHTDHSAATLELISFEIGDQEFCIDIRTVREIRGWTAATPLPRRPTTSGASSICAVRSCR